MFELCGDREFFYECKYYGLDLVFQLAVPVSSFSILYFQSLSLYLSIYLSIYLAFGMIDVVLRLPPTGAIPPVVLIILT